MVLIALLWPQAALPHDGHSPYETSGQVWVLVKLDGRPFPARATLRFPALGRIAGQAPCNRYFAAMWASFPWFKTEQIGATRRACPDLVAEAQFLAALSEMTLCDWADDQLALTSDTGRSMLFRLAASPD